jgi:hypothetical protein
MDMLDSGDRLVRDKEDGFERKSSATIVEQVLERRPKDVVNQHIVLTLGIIDPHLRDSDNPRQLSIDAPFPFKTLPTSAHVLKLYGNFLARLEIGA